MLKRSKGFTSDMGWTFILWLVVVFVGLAFLVFGLIARLPFTGMSPLSYSAEFINAANKPYLVAEVLGHFRADDRQFFEHAIQIVATGSPKNTNSLPMEESVRAFLDNYDMKYYSISIKDEKEKDLFVISNRDVACGENNKGICVNNYVSVCVFDVAWFAYPTCYPTAPKYVECGNGREKIEDINDNCGSTQVCCIEKLDSSGHNLDENGNVIPNCGPQGKKRGVCDDQTKTGKVKAVGLITIKTFRMGGCREGRVMIDKEVDVDCVDEKTSICCVPKGEAADFNILTEADVPILYKKGLLGYIEVITGV